ncbi:hypothetical protein LDENG_00146870 [Lucifuga dentata]|nr:hypothetical protein LDENG_00146870 [Lucifuga dentata]
MRLFLLLLCALCATQGHNIFEGSCLRKDPPPGVLVVSPGSKLILTCGGHVKVDGVKVTMNRDGSNTNSRASSSDRAQAILKGQDSINHTGVLKKRDKDGSVDVRLTDSGKYTCQHRGKTFSLRVTVAGPPEHPSLSCYKKSPSSKIRCEWTSQQPISVRPQCYLFLSKSLPWTFSRSQCSFSSQLSRCWCSLDHNEDEQRKRHTAYLCVTSSAGNATSNLLRFTPLSILRPDPPSDVRVQQEEGQENKITVTWRSPASWKSQDDYYQLIYEISYRPIKPQVLVLYGQTETIEKQQSYTITDALPGVEYMIQLRTKDAYDGLWSNWSAPIYARSWTAQPSTILLTDDVTPTMYLFYDGDKEGSGTDDNTFDAPESERSVVEVWHHVLWISASCVLLSVILAAYIFRHKERFVSKLQTVGVVTECRDPTQPPASPPTAPAAPAAPEGQALMTFALPYYKQPLPNEVEEEEDEKEEELRVEERREAVHFNNTSYFLVQRKC